jgi:hypothetical protein
VKLYVAGPMSGLPDDNYPEFNRVTKILRDQGYFVINPAEAFDGDHTRPRSDYARVDIEALLTVEGVVLLDGWGTSEGACTEVPIGLWLGLDFFYLDSNNRLQAARPFNPVHTFIASVKGLQARREPVSTITGEDAQVPVFEELANPANRSPESANPFPTVESVCAIADRLVATDRQQFYGHPLDDFTKTAKMVSVIVGTEVSAWQIPLIMQAVKISRELNAPKRDNLIDGCGYWKTLDLVYAEAERRGITLRKAS